MHYHVLAATVKGEFSQPTIFQLEVIKMKNEKKKKKGFFSVIRESMGKTGGCCGPGETCGGPVKKNISVTNTEKSEETEKK